MSQSSEDGLLREGMIVEHPKRSEWGPGRILALEGDKATIYFRDLPEGKPGEAIRKIDTRYIDLVAAATQNDPRLDNLPPYKAGGFAGKRPRLTFQESVELFHRLYPRYFEDDKYIDSPELGERAYKLEAHERWQAELGDGQAAALLASGETREFVKRLLAVEAKLNLLSVVEKSRLRDALKDEPAAHSFGEALLRATAGDAVDEASFEQLATAACSLPAVRSRVATWPVLTLFPFIARPDLHMFLKPEVTREFAEVVQWDLRYNAALNWKTYKSLIEMSSTLLMDLARYGARDMIDVQSFIWKVSDRGR